MTHTVIPIGTTFLHVVDYVYAESGHAVAATVCGVDVWDTECTRPTRITTDDLIMGTSYGVVCETCTVEATR